MEPLKHECGVAMIRLLKPLQFYKEKYGTYSYALNKLYLLMEKQHNRGQEGAGVGVVKMNANPGCEYVFRERALGPGAIQDIFSNIYNSVADSAESPFVGEINMGHLRYSTTGKSGLSYVHPFLRRNNWRARNLLLCGNFNMTNVEEIFNRVVSNGQHPRIYSDTVLLLEQLGYALDKENHRVYKKYRGCLENPALTERIEDDIDMSNVLGMSADLWDGGFVICGATGSGDMFALRDRHGIRPAFYYHDDEVVVLTSERPVIQTVFDVALSQVRELLPGEALIVNKAGEMCMKRILPESDNRRCSFERIYFSRGSDADIYQERKRLGRNLVPQILDKINCDLEHSVFSFIPNTAEVAFIGMVEGLEKYLDTRKMEDILLASRAGTLSSEKIERIMSSKIRVEKIAIKDIKLRTFIAEGETRNDLAAHVYDVTYGCVENGVDNLVVIDDSIVRGTTLRQSIIKILDRLHPSRIIVVSSSPQVRYPDYYGIDMSRMSEFIAFKAAVALLRERGMEHVLDDVYAACKAEDSNERNPVNHVKAVYEPFSDEEISAKIAEMLTPENANARVSIVYQTIEGLHNALPLTPGDWYFSGDYPTPGGTRLVNKAFVNYFEGNTDKR